MEMDPFGRSWMRAKSLLGLGPEHHLEVSGECPLRRPMLSDLMTDFGPPRQEPFGGTGRGHTQPARYATSDAGDRAPSPSPNRSDRALGTVPSVGREASSGRAGPGIWPYGVSVRSPHYARVDAPLVQGSLASARVNPPCRCWSSAHPSPRFRSRHDHLRRDYCQLSPAHRLRADHCLLTPGTFGLKLTQPAGSLPRHPCRRQPVVAPLQKRGLALSRPLCFPVWSRSRCRRMHFFLFAPSDSMRGKPECSAVDPSATTQGTPALAASPPTPPRQAPPLSAGNVLRALTFPSTNRHHIDDPVLAPRTPHAPS